MYLDNLRTRYLHKNIDGTDAARDMIVNRTEYSLDELGEIPDKEDFFSLEFMGECYDAGRGINFRDKDYEKNHRDNDRTMKVIARIIQIVMNWEVTG